MKNLLLIEPNIVLADIYRQALEIEGYKVQHALDAQTAIQLADDTNPDIIVLEPQLCTHGGIEFLFELRSYTEWQAIPVIVNSYVDLGALKGVKQTLKDDLGVKVCLYKPSTTLKELISATNSLVED